MHHDQVGSISEIQECFNTPKSINVINCVSGLKDKNYMIISIHVQKNFEKFQHDFKMKGPKRVELEG